MRDNEEIVTIIEERAKEKEISLSELARQVGMAKSAISRYFNRTREFPLNRVNDFARVLNLKPEYILGFEEEKTAISTIYNQLNQPRKEKVYSFAEHQLKEQRKIYNLGSTAAGPALAYTDDFVEEEKLERIPDKADFVLTIKGHSMEPRFLNGEKVFVQSASLVENGEIAIVEIDGDGVTCKKVKYDYDNQKVILQSLNEYYDDMIYSSDKVKIVGRVIG